MGLGTSNIGPLAYMIGLAAALVAGFAPNILGPSAGIVLLVAGLIVGALNVTSNESNRFLIALVAMPIAATAAGNVPAVGAMLATVINNVTAFSAAAAIVVVVKVVMDVAKR